MNKLLLSLTVLAYTISCLPATPVTEVVMVRPTIDQAAYTALKLFIGSSLTCGALRSCRETVRDWGFKELKREQLLTGWTFDLRAANAEAANLMSEKEIKFWRAVEGISLRFKLYKQEIFAALGTAGLAFLAFKFLQSGVQDLNVFLDRFLARLSATNPVIVTSPTPGTV